NGEVIEDGIHPENPASITAHNYIVGATIDAGQQWKTSSARASHGPMIKLPSISDDISDEQHILVEQPRCYQWTSCAFTMIVHHLNYADFRPDMHPPMCAFAGGGACLRHSVSVSYCSAERLRDRRLLRFGERLCITKDYAELVVPNIHV